MINSHNDIEAAADLESLWELVMGEVGDGIKAGGNLAEAIFLAAVRRAIHGTEYIVYRVGRGGIFWIGPACNAMRFSVPAWPVPDEKHWRCAARFLAEERHRDHGLYHGPDGYAIRPMSDARAPGERLIYMAIY